MKKNLGQIILVGVLSVAMILAFVAMISAIGLMSNDSFDSLDTIAGAGTQSAVSASFWSYLGIGLGLMICVGALLLKIMDKSEIAPILFLAAGSVALICILVSIGMNTDHVDALKKVVDATEATKGTPLEISHEAAKMSYYREFITPIINILIFAFAPLALGIKGLLNK